MFLDLCPEFSLPTQTLSMAIESYIKTHIGKRSCLSCIHIRTRTIIPTLTAITMPDILQVLFHVNTPRVLERNITVFDHSYHFISGIYASNGHFNTIVIRNNRVEQAESMHKNTTGQYETIAKLKDGHAINATYDNAFELRRGYFIKIN